MTFRDMSADITLDNANMSKEFDIWANRNGFIDAVARNVARCGWQGRQEEIDALMEKRDADIKNALQLVEENFELKVEIDALKAENEQLRADAERYRWFKENYLKFGSGESDTLRPIILFDSKWYGGHFNNIEDLDTAIDAAMKDFSTQPKEE